MTLIKKLCVIVLAIGACSPRIARAAVIVDFNSFAVGASNVGIPLPYEEDGFRIYSSIPTASLQIYGTDHIGFTGSNSVFLSTVGNVTHSLARSDGGLFDLISIDVRELWNGPLFLTANPFNITFTGIRPGFADVQQNAVSNGIWDSQTITFPTFQGVSRVDFDSRGQLVAYHQFDNIVVNAVPEPSSLLFASMGLGLYSFRNRMRRVRGPFN